MVCSDGSPALVGSYMVDILPQTSMFSYKEHFVTHGRQRVPLAGVSNLEPGDVLGTVSAPLLQVPLSAIPHDDWSAGLQTAVVPPDAASDASSSADCIPGPVFPDGDARSVVRQR